MLELGAAAIQRDGLGLGGGNLSLRPRNIQLRDVARAIAPLGKGERALVGDDRSSHECALDVDRAEGQIRLGNLRLYQQARALQQRFA